jgi:polar amino acid transport system substrate-binding protein
MAPAGRPTTNWRKTDMNLIARHAPAGRGNMAMILAATTLIATSTMSANASAQSRLEEIKESGDLSVAMAVEPPFANFDGGKISGAGPEVLMAAMKKLGVENFEAQITDWGAMIPGLQARRYDVIATGLFMREERCEAILFSQPDLCSTWGFAVKEGNPKNLRSIEDLVSADAMLGACGGCAAEKTALETGLPRDNILNVTDPLGGMKMLDAGRIDALVYSDVSLYDALKKSGVQGVEIVAPLTGGAINCAGVGFHPDDRELRDAYDEALAELKESGEFAAIVEKYNFNPQYAMDKSREELCGVPN